MDAMPDRCEKDDAAERERFLRDQAEAIEGIRRGLESAARGEGRPAEEVFAELRAKYGSPHGD
jgi:predicted transcriptional regulator